MKKFKILAATLVTSLMILSNPISVNADEEPQLIKARATAYCLSGTTASGQTVRDGVCAGKKEWLGKTILVYKRLPDNSVGDLIDIYECLDAGGTEAIKTGKVIDVWCEDYSSCKDFMNLIYEDGCEGKIYIQVVDAVG